MSIWGRQWTRFSAGLENPDFIFRAPWVVLTVDKESTVLGEGMRLRARKLGRASCSSRHKCVAHPILRSARARSGSLMSM